MTDYTNIMTRALAARKAVSGGRVRIGRSFKRHSGARSREESLPGAGKISGGGGLGGQGAVVSDPEKRWSAMADRQQKEANVGYTKAATEKAKTGIKVDKVQLKAKKLSNIAKGLNNAVGFLPTVEQSNYSDFHNWITESNFVPTNTFKSPEDVQNMTPLEFKVYKSNLSTLGNTSMKTLAELDKIKGAEEKEAIRVKTAKARVDAAEKLANAKKEKNRVDIAQKKMGRILGNYRTKSDLSPEELAEYEQLEAIENEAGGIDEQQLDENIARSILEEAGGDPARATEIARERGFKLDD